MNIFSHNDAIEIPDWHLNILAERATAVTEGNAQYDDWEVAKIKIRELLKTTTKGD